jgi:hypothetical protein
VKLTELEENCLEIALEYSLSDYESNLEYMVKYGFDAEELKYQRKLVKGLQRVQAKFLNELEEKNEYRRQ